MADNSAYKDAQAQNDISRNVRQYSDLDLFFGKRPVGSDVNRITDVVSIKRAIEAFEPRCRLVAVISIPDLDRNAYNVTIEFYIQNAPTELATLDVMLERLR